MASATFTLRAVDQTRAAFASVQNSLQKTNNFARDISKKLTSFFGFQAAINGVRRLNAAMEEAEKSGAKMGLTQEEVDSLTKATSLYDKAVQNIQISVGKLATMLSKAFGSTTTAADAVAVRNERVLDQVKDINSEIEKQIVQNDLLLQNDGARVAYLRTQVQAAENRIKMAKDDLAVAQATLELEKARGDLKAAANKLQEDEIDLIEEQRALRVQLNAAVGVERDESKVIKDLLQARLELTREIAQADKSTDQGLADQNIFRAERNRIDKELLPLLESRYSLEKQIGSVVADSFQTAIFEGGKFINVLKEMLSQILKLVFFETVTKRLASKLSSFLIANPLAGVNVGAPVNLGQALGFPGFANGGQITRGKPAIVGERGPELFVPTASGSIIPNHRLGSGGGSGMGGGVTINYNISSGVSRGELVPILEAERKRLKAEIPDMVRRGGAYRAAFA